MTRAFLDPSAAPEPKQAGEALRRAFLQLAKERPQAAMETFQDLLDVGRGRNDLALVERAYCSMALLYALRGDAARATERLGHARMAAVRRGHTLDVESLTQQIDAFLSGSQLPKRGDEK